MVVLKLRARLGPSYQDARDVAPGGIRTRYTRRYAPRIAQTQMKGRSEAARLLGPSKRDGTKTLRPPYPTVSSIGWVHESYSGTATVTLQDELLLLLLILRGNMVNRTKYF